CDGASARSFENRDAPGQPVDVDVELALARGNRDAPAVAAAVRIEADRADVAADDVILRGEELELDLLRQRMHVRIAIDAKAPAGDVEREEGLAPLRQRFAPRETQSCGERACRAAQLGRRHRTAEHREYRRGDDRHQHEDDQDLEQREAACASGRRYWLFASQLVMSLLTPSPPS